jgi:hypothetical protein
MAKSSKGQWIQGAIKHPGALRAKAKKAGMTVAQYCSQEHSDKTTQRQCQLFHTLQRLRKGKSK